MKKETNILVTLCAIVIALLPFHAFLTVWASSLAGHYTLLRLWKELILAILVVGCLFVTVRRKGMVHVVRRQPLVLLIGAYLALLVAAGGLALALGGVTPKAYAYGLLLDSRFLIFFVVVWLVSRRDNWIGLHWRQLLLIPAAVVVVFGILQFTLLPADFLGHFGYGPDTINAVQTVDQKDSYQRIQSTLRGANPLGAYLIIPLAALGALVLSGRRRRGIYAFFLVAAGAALAMTFSRSAWIGALAAIGWLLWQNLPSTRTRQLLLVAGSAAVLVFAATGFVLRNNDTFQNTILHTDEHSRSAASSNQDHLAASRKGLKDIARQPFGRGTGTAGPASAYNDHPARIAENFYIQIGQEVGIVGLALFAAINLVLARGLWQRRRQVLPQVLLASLIGLAIVNLLSHAWTDDTLSYIWWGLAGAAIAAPDATSLQDRV